jgi:membrane-associated phospholipid phosphatase
MAIFVAALFLIRTPRIRLAVIAMAVFLVPLVGVCRLYLGVHYPTDILAGWALSLAWVSALGIACNIFSMDNVVHTRPLLHKNFLLKDPY